MSPPFVFFDTWAIFKTSRPEWGKSYFSGFLAIALFGFVLATVVHGDGFDFCGGTSGFVDSFGETWVFRLDL